MIYLVGDIHQTVDIEKMHRLKNVITPNDYVIILGDFGLLWSNIPSQTEKELKNFYDSFKCPILWVDGNHENFSRIKELPSISKYGSSVGVVSNNIFHLKRGNIYTIENKTFFAFGGARSIDCMRRMPYVDWWPEEMPSAKEYENGLSNLEKYNNKVDYIITHDAPLNFYKEAYNHIEENDLNRYLDIIDSQVEFKHWYFGHHHMDEEIDNKHTVLYNTIRTIENK